MQLVCIEQVCYVPRTYLCTHAYPLFSPFYHANEHLKYLLTFMLSTPADTADNSLSIGI